MSSSKNKIFQTTSFLEGSNSSYIEELYDKYAKDPNSIQESWREFFSGLSESKQLIENEASGASWKPTNLKNNQNGDLDHYEKLLPEINVLELKNKIVEDKQFDSVSAEVATKDSVRAIMMIRAYRIRGHLIADLDPLGLTKSESHPELNPETYGFSAKDRDRKIFLDDVLGLKYATVNEILAILLRTYCSKVGVEYMHMTDPDEKSWIQHRIEGEDRYISFTVEGKRAILNRLLESEGFEKYLHTKFVGTKRFGLDGCESLIPAMEQIIKRGGALGALEVKIGMPHRGRLNILTNVLQKPLKKNV